MRQEISQLLDGELGAADSAAAITRLSADKRHERQWEKLCIVRAVMRGDYVEPTDSMSSFADKVSLSLESEPAILAPNNLLHLDASGATSQGDKNNVTAFPQRTKQLAMGGLALVVSLAASFFAVTLFNINPFNATDNDAPQNIAATQSTEVNKLAAFLAAEQELQALVVAHGEFSSMAGLNGLAAYAKIVNADGAQ